MERAEELFGVKKNEFFTVASTRKNVKAACDKISSLHDNDNFKQQLYGCTAIILQSMSVAADEWEMNCPYNIEWIGHALLNCIKEVGAVESDSVHDIVPKLYAICYRFLLELYLNIRGDLNMELLAAKQFAVANIEKWEGDARDQVLHALYAMPLDLLKKAQGEEVVARLKNWDQSVLETNGKIEGWARKLEEQERRAIVLHQALQKYESAYNFVGLHQGFESLATDKENTLRLQRVWMIFFGLLLPVPFIFTLSILATHVNNIESLKNYALLAGVPVASVTIILLYFFRIALSNVNSTKSQLLQIDLRKTLCRFIQSYADYSAEIRSKNADSLSRFESIIFSGIVSNDEKIPSTFDGLEQVSALIKSLRSKD